jgi:hypothetical protein
MKNDSIANLNIFQYGQRYLYKHFILLIRILMHS